MIVVVDYGAGNLTSVRLAFESLRRDTTVTADPAAVRSAGRIVFPGVGAAGAAMRNLAATGMADALRDGIARGVPFLGICLGTQILFDRSEEDGGVACLGIIPGAARRFTPADRADKVPHMGWNSVKFARPHTLFDGLEDESEFYFVHSYFPSPAKETNVLGRTGYAGVSFASVVAAGNVVATQFHPEKSGRLGLQLLRNFCSWDGSSC